MCKLCFGIPRPWVCSSQWLCFFFLVFRNHFWGEKGREIIKRRARKILLMHLYSIACTVLLILVLFVACVGANPILYNIVFLCFCAGACGTTGAHGCPWALIGFHETPRNFSRAPPGSHEMKRDEAGSHEKSLGLSRDLSSRDFSLKTPWDFP